MVDKNPSKLLVVAILQGAERGCPFEEENTIRNIHSGLKLEKYCLHCLKIIEGYLREKEDSKATIKDMLVKYQN